MNEKGETGNNTVIVGDFNSPFTSMVRFFQIESQQENSGLK